VLSKRSQQSRVRMSNCRAEIGPSLYHKTSLFEQSLHEHYNAFLKIAINFAVIKTTVVFLPFSTDPHRCHFQFRLAMTITALCISQGTCYTRYALAQRPSRFVLETVKYSCNHVMVLVPNPAMSGSGHHEDKSNQQRILTL
jgi:hypothetical protein